MLQNPPWSHLFIREKGGLADRLELEFRERWGWADNPTWYRIDSCRGKLGVPTLGAD